jgi:hypothetical protein
MAGDFIAPHKKNIHIRAYVDFYGGYANHAREVIFGLDNLGTYNVHVSPIKCPIDLHPDLFNKMRWYVNNPAFEIKDSIFLVIAGPGHLQKQFIPEDRKVVGWTMIETLGVQPEIVEWCNNADLILCPTEIDYKRMKEAGVKNLMIVPIGYDPKQYNRFVEPADIINLRNRYVFGYSGSWNHRKGVEDIVRAYCNEFSSKEPVSLLLISKYGNRPYGDLKEDKTAWGIRVELQKLLATIKRQDMPHICVVDVPLHPPALPHLYARVNAAVGFSMGESTWLPGLEFGAMKKPIIQLRNQACGYMDYLEGSRYLCNDVRYLEADERLYEGTSEYYKGQKLGVGNHEELSSMMRLVYEERGTKEQAQEIKKVFERVSWRTWENSIDELNSALEQVR